MAAADRAPLLAGGAAPVRLAFPEPDAFVDAPERPVLLRFGGAELRDAGQPLSDAGVGAGACAELGAAPGGAAPVAEGPLRVWVGGRAVDVAADATVGGLCAAAVAGAGAGGATAPAGERVRGRPVKAVLVNAAIATTFAVGIWGNVTLPTTFCDRGWTKDVYCPEHSDAPEDDGGGDVNCPWFCTFHTIRGLTVVINNQEVVLWFCLYFPFVFHIGYCLIELCVSRTAAYSVRTFLGLSSDEDWAAFAASDPVDAETAAAALQRMQRQRPEVRRWAKVTVRDGNSREWWKYSTRIRYGGWEGRSGPPPRPAAGGVTIVRVRAAVDAGDAGVARLFADAQGAAAQRKESAETPGSPQTPATLPATGRERPQRPFRGPGPRRGVRPRRDAAVERAPPHRREGALRVAPWGAAVVVRRVRCGVGVGADARRAVRRLRPRAGRADPDGGVDPPRRHAHRRGGAAGDPRHRRPVVLPAAPPRRRGAPHAAAAL